MPKSIVEILKKIKARMLRFSDGDPVRLAEHLVLAVLVAAVTTLGGLDLVEHWTERNEKPADEISWTELRAQLADGRISSLEIATTVSNEVAAAQIAAHAKDEGKGTVLPAVPLPVLPDLLEAARQGGADVSFKKTLPVEFGGKPEKSRLDSFASVVFKALGFALPFALGWIIMQQLRTMSGFSKKPARGASGDAKVRFSDVAGCREAKQELAEAVEFLADPERFAAVGAEPPRGVLMAGPPGNGKTLLARAVAGEAGCAFLQASGAEFEEMFVGLGAKRVRELFANARRMAPCIIFIDEIDALAPKRRVGAAPFENQTINQILTEMDGFSQKDGVVVIAATNLAEGLDGALTRPGRFTRHIAVTQPDAAARRELLGMHAKKKPFAAGLDLDKLARGTSGLSGADLANLCNEAAIRAARAGRTEIVDADFEAARDRILLGTETSIALDSEERRLIAVHEAGHAVAAALSKESDRIHKATILPRGGALGMVLRLPDGDRVVLRRSKILADLRVALAGRAAEMIVFGEGGVSTGAGADLKAASAVALRMAKEWGMADTLVEPGTGGAGEEAARAAAERILRTALEEATAILNENRDGLTAVADALLERETLDGAEIDALLALAADGDPISG